MNYIGDALISKRRKKGCAGHVEDSVWSSSASTVKRRRVGDVAEERVAVEEEEPKNGNNYFMVHRLAQDTDGGRMWRTSKRKRRWRRARIKVNISTSQLIPQTERSEGTFPPLTSSCVNKSVQSLIY